jgi:hypothetical protein
MSRVLQGWVLLRCGGAFGIFTRKQEEIEDSGLLLKVLSGWFRNGGM